jgi:hypothetical protein
VYMYLSGTQQSFKVGAIVIQVIQKRKLRQTEIETFLSAKDKFLHLLSGNNDNNNGVQL